MKSLTGQASSEREDQLGPDAMRQWGWRLPFLVAIVPGAFTIAGHPGLNYLLPKLRQAVSC